jgi:DUF1680 family protein
LQNSVLVKLPIGSIKPKGWLGKQLRLQAEGFHGHLTEISGFLVKDGNAWLSSDGSGDHGWEEVPYWLKGYLNCAYVLGDDAMIEEAKLWVEGALGSRKEDGWFGPDGSRGGVATKLKGRADLWPNAIMLHCLQDYYDASGDERVIDLMKGYFDFLRGVPEDKYLLGYWPKMRGGDILYSIYWLYNRTGDEGLLELAAKNHRRTARWDEDVVNWHNVNVAQAFGEGATWWQQSGDDSDLRSAYRNWSKVRELYGQMPGGMFAADENAREGCDDPRQCVETCGMVEKMLSDEVLVGITGDVYWADCCEDVAYNSLAGAFTADMKGLRYLTGANQVISDDEPHDPGIQNGGPMFEMNPHIHRCCQHNAGHGWPYFAEHLWYASADNGLAAIFYSACDVRAKVGDDGQEVVIEQETGYPFDEVVSFNFSSISGGTVSFPLYLRVPGWCEGASVVVNGESLAIDAAGGQYILIEREWRRGDVVKLKLPMSIKVRKWAGNKGSVSVYRGPLSYSLRIEENKVRSGGSDEWPAWEILPGSSWNYALVVDGSEPGGNFEVVAGEWPDDDMVWRQSGVPLKIKAKGKLVPGWGVDEYGLCDLLPESPVESDQAVEEIELVPMGAARLRISSFPVAAD